MLQYFTIEPDILSNKVAILQNYLLPLQLIDYFYAY